MPSSTSSPDRLSAENARAQVQAKTAEIGMMPAVAMQALELTNDPDCSITQFAQVVERDTKLAADILSISNSAIYSPSKPILSLNEAVVRLGFQQCKNLILSSSVSALMKKLPLGEEWIRESLSRHSFTTGLLAVKLNRALNIGCHGEEFTAGLLHDFGRMLFAVCFPKEFPKIDQMEFDEESLNFIDREREIIGIDHCEIGAWYAEENGLPGVFADAIRFHHTPERALAGRLTSLVAVSDHMANHLQRHGAADGYDIQKNNAISVLDDRGAEGVNTRINDIALHLMDEVVAEVEDLLGF